MSDHRFGLKVDFSIYGKNFEWDASLNWNAHDGGCDSRITEWFTTCYEEARAAWDADNAAADELRRRTGVEQRERAELARLKAKYEPNLTAIPLTANPLIPQPDAIASGDTFDRNHDPLGSHGTKWVDPTPAGVYTATRVTCQVCGHVVRVEPGDVVRHGDPRLCVHLGGPKRHDPECYLRTENGSPCTCDDIDREHNEQG